MIKLIKLQQSNFKNLSGEILAIKQLYLSAFSRRERPSFKYLINTCKRDCVELYEIKYTNQFAGFIYLVNLNDITNILYFAVSENMRSLGIGSEVLQQIVKQKKRVFLEIENENAVANNTEQRKKRKKFYIKNGFSDINFNYKWHGENYVTLASGGGSVNREDILKFWKEMKKERLNRL